MVKVYRLLCRNTYEREMFDKASLKLGLDKAILQSMNTSQGGKEPSNKQLTKKEIEDLLKKGAYGAIMDDDNAGDKFCEEDIEQILERRTQVSEMILHSTILSVERASLIDTNLEMCNCVDHYDRSRKGIYVFEGQLRVLVQ